MAEQSHFILLELLHGTGGHEARAEVVSRFRGDGDGFERVLEARGVSSRFSSS